MLSEMEMMAAMGLPTSLGGKAVARPASAEAAGRRDPTAQCKAAAWADESERTCKRCARSLSAIMYTPKQWTKATPCCIDCSFELRMAGEGAELREDAEAEADAEAAAGGRAASEGEPAEADPCDVAARQLEYYFLPKNWAKDDFLRKLADDDGSVAVEAFFQFPRIAALLPSARGIGMEADGVFLRRCVRYSASLEMVRCTR